MRVHLTIPRAPWAKADRSSNASLQMNRGRQVDTAQGRLDACEKADASDLSPKNNPCGSERQSSVPLLKQQAISVILRFAKSWEFS
jgi:hypothetical protein